VSQVRYDDVTTAQEFDEVRDRRSDGIDIWCRRIATHLDRYGGAGRRGTVVDVGAGTGIWSQAIAGRCGVAVVGVEPSTGMRTHAAVRHAHPDVRYVGGVADALPLADGVVAGAWLSTVVHQLPDVAAAAGEVRRVLTPGAPVMVRASFPGRHDEHEHFQRFPSALALASTWPRLGDVITAFEDAGFHLDAFERVREPSFDSYDELLALLPSMRRSDTALVGIPDDEWERGIARIRRARDRGERPWQLGLDLVVFR
jgi:ubiquinone/menaquinone biosynthesis C-methylase UbiE